MGYPVITRLGISQFWYNHWYSDTTFFLNSKQDSNLLKLFKIYINYGVTFPTSVFFHEYFFNKKQENTRKSFVFKNWKFYRKVFFSCESLEIEHSYFIRKKTGEFFPLRLWLFRYSRWIIVSFACFKPLKIKKSNFIKVTKKETHSVSPRLNTPTNYNRIKLLFIFLKKRFFKNYNYSF
jgi:hypothetical protein